VIIRGFAQKFRGVAAKLGSVSIAVGNKIHEFGKNRDANIALIFALALIPLVGAVGAAVDYSRANSARTAMQAALDSTALMLSKTANGMSPSDPALATKATNFFRAMFNRPEAQSVTVTPTYTPSNNTIVLTGSGFLRSDFVNIFGISQINIGASSTITWGGGSKMQVALVLDNTGSMTETDATGTSKMTALKTATHSLLTTLQNAAKTAGDVQVAIIPFNTYVKVDSTTWKTKPWINWNASGGGGDGGNNGNGNNNGCNGGDGGNGNNNSDPCNPTASTWNGCFTDRTQPNDVQNTAPTAGLAATYFPAVDCSLAQISPLSYDWTALNAKVDTMVAAGTTNQPIGLAWGWHALSQGDPLNAPTPPANSQKIIIILTDGLNTQNRWSTNQASIDARETLVCANIKAAGITVYTVLVMAGNSSVLQSCASDTSKYFALSSTGEISTTFANIGNALAKLRIER
jgi:Flp pilus assembly protein TadG